MVSDYIAYYDVVKKLSLFTGAWPYLKPRTKLYRVAFTTIIMLTILVPQVAQHITCKSDLKCIFETMTSYFLSITILLKLYTFHINNRNIKDLTECVFLDWEDLKTPEEYQIMKSYATNSRRFSILYSIYVLGAVFLFMSLSFIPYALDVISPLNETRPIVMPYPGCYLVDEKEYFFYIVLHSIVAWEVGMAALAFHDCMFVTYTEHVCSVFAIISHRCTQLFYDFNHGLKMMNIYSDDVYYKKVRFSIQTHQRVLEFSQLLENTFTVPFVIQVSIITTLISITLLQIDLESGETIKTIRYFIYIVGQMIHLFFLSFEGQRLINHSLEMRDTIYDSFWYELPMKSQKLLMFMMMRSLRPVSLTAGKIYVFSLNSFSVVLQTAVSYFTVLRTV